MNPMGGELKLDRYNARIVEVTRPRRFGPGPFHRNVLDRVDTKALAEALLVAIGANVRFRNANMREALEAARESRFVAAQRARKAMSQDQHLAQVAQLAAVLLIELDRPAEGVLMMEQAAQLYGLRTRPGLAASAEAAHWRSRYKSYLTD